MKNKLIVLIILTLQLIIAQTPVFNSPYLTDEMRSNTKELLKFDKVVLTIKDEDRVEKLKKQVKFYRAVSEAIYIELNNLNQKNSEKINKFESLIKQYKDVINLQVDDINLIETPSLNYEYKPMKITSTAVKKQNHKKQAKLMKKNYLTMFKHYKEVAKIYTNYLQYLKEVKETGKYKVNEDLISDSKNQNNNQSNKQVGNDSSNVANKDENTSIVDSKETIKQVNTEQLEKINEELTYRIESLEVRIDEFEEEENKKSNGMSNKVKNIETKIKSLEKNNKEVKNVIDVMQKEYDDYSKRDFPETLIDAKQNGLTQFTYRGKTIYAFTRKEYKEAMIDARIYGKEKFQIGNIIYDTKLEYEQIERITK